jgi:hypothetical protein
MAALTSRAPYCFKDPRFSYTLPWWRPHLADDTVFLCVFREPGRTAQSILTEVATQRYRGFTISLERALEVWTLMYRHILDIHRRDGAWLFLHFEQLLDPAHLDRLSELLDARVDHDFPSADLRRSANIDAVPPATRATYDELCELAGFRPSADEVERSAGSTT